MKIFILKQLSDLLEGVCDALHKFETIDWIYFKISILLFGYNCPLAHWSCLLDKKYNLNVWSK